jgi:hypothetical protein
MRSPYAQGLGHIQLVLVGMQGCAFAVTAGEIRPEDKYFSHTELLAWR